MSQIVYVQAPSPTEIAGGAVIFLSNGNTVTVSAKDWLKLDAFLKPMCEDPLD